MLRGLLLPTLSSAFGVLSIEAGASAAAGLLMCWHLLSITTGFRSAWVLYSVWMAVSSAALFYGRAKRDLGHVQWFAIAMFIDVLVYATGIAFDAELQMTNIEQCNVAMAANPGLTVEQCLEHVHEIKAIAYAMRLAVLASKAYLAAMAYSYELRCGFGVQIQRASVDKPASTDAPAE
ncbi:hypothetical protein J3B02_006327 [Coemansia erecta]|uniref:Uncharacterized protein n=1 Tax=Coemansia asiatica TaxID=1052880 RepID=A0A9W7XLA8_9FUNG|nr:hypothetical protein LPJ64_003304 [Coemansia asiatica]KAJ2839030.1 hypothetical protein J3B02_006327 [Coemansia erecta]KAJ2879723.1 hypothetical protein FB639_003016 [Coemansia asiatica]